MCVAHNSHFTITQHANNRYIIINDQFNYILVLFLFPSTFFLLFNNTDTFDIFHGCCFQNEFVRFSLSKKKKKNCK